MVDLSSFFSISWNSDLQGNAQTRVYHSMESVEWEDEAET
jgi:hypothetical protein